MLPLVGLFSIPFQWVSMDGPCVEYGHVKSTSVLSLLSAGHTW